MSRVEDFVDGRIYRLQARRGYVSEIRLGAGDAIATDPMGGDTDGWDVVSPIGATVVTVKPRLKAISSNLILQTASRSYLVDLEVIPDTSPCKGERQLSFRVPAPPVVLMPEPPAVVAAREAQAVQEAMNDVPPARNWSYTMQALPGSDDILPTEVYDDGRFTFIRIPGNRDVPSVFRIAADGTESFVERHMEGRDLIVVHEISRRWVLRLDKQTVGIWNEAFDIEGVPPVAGTRSDRVRRVVRGEQR
jgi:type IV secretion system protein VirB9